jgi:hypothetical protein
MFGSRISKAKRVKIRSISAFKPNTPFLSPSRRLHGPEALRAGGQYSLRAVGYMSPLRAGGQHSYTLHVDIPQIATDIPITNRIDSHPTQPTKKRTFRSGTSYIKKAVHQ